MATQRQQVRQLQRVLRQTRDIKHDRGQGSDGVSFKTGSGAVSAQLDESQSFFDGLGEDLQTSTAGRFLQSAINKKRSRIPNVANKRASRVATSDNSQKETRAINSLIQSGKRRVRGASVALPRFSAPAKTSLLR